MEFENRRKVSVMIPCYNEEDNLPVLYRHLKPMMEAESDFTWEILLINDGSKDKTLEVIKTLGQTDKRISYIDLSRNFGKEAAMLAGFDYATGDCLVVMDADLQDPVEVIPEMLKCWKEGYDDIYARRTSRGRESWLRKSLSLFYYRLLQRTTRLDVLQNVGDFRLLDRKCIESLKRMRESERYTKGMYCWIGFRKKELLFERGDRQSGKSAWNFMSLLNLAIDGITSYTTAPLRIATIVDLLVSVVAFLYMCYIIVKTL